jgi:hypothetical protein
VVAGPDAHEAEDERREHRAHERAGDDVGSDEQREGRPGEGEFRDAVHGEGEVAHHDEGPDESAQQAQHRPGDQ